MLSVSERAVAVVSKLSSFPAAPAAFAAVVVEYLLGSISVGVTNAVASITSIQHP